MAKFLRGQDCLFTPRLNNVPLTPFSVNTGTFNRGLDVEEVALVGQDVPDADGINTLPELTVDHNPRNTVWADMADAQAAKNAGDIGAEDFIIEIEFTVDFKQGGRARYLMADAVLVTDATQVPAGSDRVTQGWTFRGRVRRL